ncbi:hypothetical protein GALL_483760 [mine drainage metagenome]|uniref:Uncharacterized protein n=1 Tax=mine drainage metagenome TaxID=410659 RepID=A0A1J5PQI9_9ZZZZ
MNEYRHIAGDFGKIFLHFFNRKIDRALEVSTGKISSRAHIQNELATRQRCFKVFGGNLTRAVDRCPRQCSPCRCRCQRTLPGAQGKIGQSAEILFTQVFQYGIDQRHVTPVKHHNRRVSGQCRQRIMTGFTHELIQRQLNQFAGCSGNGVLARCSIQQHQVAFFDEGLFSLQGLRFLVPARHPVAVDPDIGIAQFFENFSRINRQRALASGTVKNGFAGFWNAQLVSTGELFFQHIQRQAQSPRNVAGHVFAHRATVNQPDRFADGTLFIVSHHGVVGHLVCGQLLFCGTGIKSHTGRQNRTQQCNNQNHAFHDTTP